MANRFGKVAVRFAAMILIAAINAWLWPAGCVIPAPPGRPVQDTGNVLDDYQIRRCPGWHRHMTHR